MPEPLVGDKVRIKRRGVDGSQARGVVVAVDDSRLTVRMADSDVRTLDVGDVVNFSLAARKAWHNMPSRKVGRPKGSKLYDRISVTIRVDRHVWERFRLAESQGLVADRTSTLNMWISEGLSRANFDDRTGS